MPNAKLFLIDGHALCYRSFYAIRDLINSKGRATNAIYGFINTLKKIQKDYEPEYLAVCFDSKGKTKREEKYDQYKIQRPQMPEDLRPQIPIIKDILKLLSISSFEAEGYEADDIMATMALKAKEKNFDVVIVSDDKDMFQLANQRIRFLSPRKEEMFGEKELEAKYGFNPKLMVDYLALAGDKTDNIPGVMGIGDVTARKLIQEHGNLETILKNVDRVKPAKLQEKLVANKKSAELSKELATLERKVPVKFDLMTIKVGKPDRDKLFEMFKELEFRRLALEYSPDDEANVKVNTIKAEARKDIGELVKRIQKEGKVAVLVSDEEGQVDGSGIAMSVGPKKSFELKRAAIKEIKKVLEDKNIVKITCNVKSLYHCLSKMDCSLSGPCFDVMLAGYLCAPSQRVKLADFVWDYLKQDLGEGMNLALQVQSIWQLYPILEKELKEKSLKKLFDDIETPLSFVLYQMESEGVKVDTVFLEKLSADCEKQIKGLETKLFKSAGEEFNLNSPKQLSKILFEKLALPVIKKTKTGFSTDESVLTTLAQSHEFPQWILQYRQLAKLKSTYIDALPKLVDSKTGRIHGDFNQIGAETGRLSSSNPNLQNIPIRTELGQQIRKAFVPLKKGHILLAADYSQIELRILADLSKDKGLMNAFKNNQDIHNYTASLIFDVDEKDVTKEMRYATKRVNFGIIYGMSAFGLAKDLNVSQLEAQEFIDKYFLRYPNVKKFMDEQIRSCEKKGYVLTLFNRRRYIPEIKSKNMSMRQFAQRQAINTPVQGSAADLIKLAMINIHKELKKKNLASKMLITVHDELVFDVPKDEKDKMVKLVRDFMENPIKLSVPIRVSIKTGMNWLEMKDA